MNKGNSGLGWSETPRLFDLISGLQIGNPGVPFYAGRPHFEGL